MICSHQDIQSLSLDWLYHGLIIQNVSVDFWFHVYYFCRSKNVPKNSADCWHVKRSIGHEMFDGMKNVRWNKKIVSN